MIWGKDGGTDRKVRQWTDGIMGVDVDVLHAGLLDVIYRSTGSNVNSTLYHLSVNDPCNLLFSNTSRYHNFLLSCLLFSSLRIRVITMLKDATVDIVEQETMNFSRF